MLEYFLYWFAWFGPRQPKTYNDAVGSTGASSTGAYSYGYGSSTPIKSAFLDKSLEFGRELTHKVLHHGPQRRSVRPYVQLFSRYLEFFCAANRTATNKAEAETFLGIVQDYWLVDPSETIAGGSGGGGGYGTFSYASYRSEPLPPGDLLDCLSVLAEYTARAAAGLEPLASQTDAAGQPSPSGRPSRLNPFSRGNDRAAAAKIARLLSMPQRPEAQAGGFGPPSAVPYLFSCDAGLHVEIYGRLYGLLWRCLSQLALSSTQMLYQTDTLPLLHLLRSCAAPWEERGLAAAGRPTSAPDPAAPAPAGPSTPGNGPPPAAPGPGTYRYAHHIQQVRLCVPIYSGLIPLFLDVCCDRIRARASDGRRALEEAREALLPLLHAPDVLREVEAVEARIRNPQINTNPKALGPEVHPAFKYRPVWERWVAAALGSPGPASK